MAEVPGQFGGRDGDAGRDREVRLPPRRFSFVGRTADLAEVAARLGRYPVVTLTGVGGVGKTALAIETAWNEVSAGRAERACYVDLVPCRTGEQVVAALAKGQIAGFCTGAPWETSNTKTYSLDWSGIRFPVASAIRL